MKVAKVIDQYTVAITRKDGGSTLRKGTILNIGSDAIIDPETGENIGSIPKLSVKVTEVYTKFVVAETYRIAYNWDAVPPTVVVNVGDPVTRLP